MRERRSEPRCAATWPMRAAHGTAGCVFGMTIDVGATSASFALAEQYEVGDCIEVEIAVTSQTLLRCTARIIRAEAFSDDHIRYAARLEDFADNDRQILAVLVRVLDESRSDPRFSRVIVARAGRSWSDIGHPLIKNRLASRAENTAREPVPS